jgi:DNA replication protein DnaC
MANITDIKEQTRLLNLQNIAKGNIELFEIESDKLEFLAEIFSKELALRKQSKTVKLIKESNLPEKTFEFENLYKATVWQIEKLLKFEWIDNNEHLLIIGKCNTGKTSLLSYIGRKAIEKGYKALYITIEEFLNYDNRLHDSDLIILDNVMYLPLMKEELQKFYKKLMFLNETRSIVIITNRELSDWISAAEDKHLMQTLLDRFLLNSRTLRLD